MTQNEQDELERPDKEFLELFKEPKWAWYRSQSKSQYQSRSPSVPRDEIDHPICKTRFDNQSNNHNRPVHCGYDKDCHVYEGQNRFDHKKQPRQ